MSLATPRANGVCRCQPSCFTLGTHDPIYCSLSRRLALRLTFFFFFYSFRSLLFRNNNALFGEPLLVDGRIISGDVSLKSFSHSSVTLNRWLRSLLVAVGAPLPSHIYLPGFTKEASAPTAPRRRCSTPAR
jgi:hypothetical protein